MFPMVIVHGGGVLSDWGVLALLLTFAAVGIVDIYQGHTDVALSNFALRYRNTQLLSEELVPRVPVDRQADKYWIYGTENLEADDDDIRAPGAPSKQVDVTLSSDTYSCPDHSRAAVLPIEEGASDDPTLDSRRQRKTQVALEKLLLRREILAASLYATNTNYATGNKVQLSGNDQWNSGDAAATPIADIEAGKETVLLKSGFMPNVMLMGQQVFTALRSSSLINTFLPDTRLGIATEEDLARIFGVDRVIVWKAIKKTSGANTFVFGKHAVLMYLQPVASMEDVSFAKTFVWRSAPGTTGGFATIIGPLPPASRRSEEISVHWYYDMKITSNVSAYLIEDAVA